MKAKSLWLWLSVALVLLVFIFFHQRQAPNTVAGASKILPNLKALAVTSLQVKPAGRPEIRAERTNGAWQLTTPLSYPAQGASIENLLAALENLTPATWIAGAELKDHPKADEEFGFAPEQSAIFILQGDYRAQLKIGARTSPGDQVFLQVVGKEGIWVADADLLKLIPTKADDWRDTTLINLDGLAFDRVSVTNGATIFQLQRDGTNKLWRLISPNQARANSARIEELLLDLQQAVVNRFVPEEPKPDLEALGLQPPEWQLAFGQDTNPVALLQFGKSPTNDPHQTYARLPALKALVAVSNDFLAPWRGPVNDFRDPHLLAFTAPVDAIEVRGRDSFSLLRQTNDTWRVWPQNFPADTLLVRDMLSSLSGMQVTQFVKDVVIEPDLPTYGLALPALQYTLKSAETNSLPQGGTTNAVIAQLSFGTNADEKVFFARRADESFVYAVTRSEVERLPTASWQMRARQLWSHKEDEVASVTVRQHGKTRQILHQGQHSWSLAPGSQGSIEDLAVEQTVRDLCRLTARFWVAHGAEDRARCGFAEDGHAVTLELKNGEKRTVEFGAESPAGLPYAAVCLDGDLWIFEISPSLHRDVMGCLTIPANLL